MSTDQVINPELIEQTKQQIRSLVGEIAQLARQDIGAAEFYSEFLNRVVTALAAVGGAVWTVAEGGGLQLEYQVNLRETRLGENEEDTARHGRLLHKVLRSGEGALAAPFSGAGDESDDKTGNPTPMLLVLGPVQIEGEPKGLVEIFQRPSADIRTQRGYLKFLMQMCELMGDFLRSRQLRQYSDRQTLWNQLENFTRAAHTSLDPSVAAFTIVNEARRLIGCDRVSVALRKGRKCRVEAVSGQDVMDRRSNTVVLLSELATAVVAAGEPVWYSGDTSDMAPQVENALQAYVDESHAKNVAVLPLIRPEAGATDEDAPPPTAIGALIVEQIEDSRPRDGMVQRVNVVCEHSATALGNALEHNSLFLLPVWRSLGKARWVLAARTLPKTILISLAVIGAVIALCVVPANFKIQGKGKLQPVIRRDVSASVEGTVTKVYVEHGATVRKGQLLADLQNTDLDVKITEVEGTLSEVNENLSSISRHLIEIKKSSKSDPRQSTASEEAKLASEESQAKEKLLSLRAQLKILLSKRERLKITSPIDGQVTTWDVDNLLEGRTVQPGQVLMSISDPNGDWELEVLIPEEHMGYIARAQKEANQHDLKVTYILENDPSHWHEGKVGDVHLAAEVRGEDGNTVLVHVAIDKHDLQELSQGAGVRSNVFCGKRAVGFVWFHDLIEFLHSRVLFRI
ncbi:MAG TPA: biotin/lipoyl-binding protein [Pirellulales bacterium]|jgi:multidrug efflux pump subunit AcrA (membrane-fusion protein)